MQAEECSRFVAVAGRRVVPVALAAALGEHFNFRAAHQWLPRNSKHHAASVTTAPTTAMIAGLIKKEAVYSRVPAPSSSEAGQAFRTRVGKVVTRVSRAAVVGVHIHMCVRQLRKGYEAKHS